MTTFESETDLYRQLGKKPIERWARPQMQVDVIEAGTVKTLVRLAGARTVLEVGMFTGYSALMMAEGLPAAGHLITCEVDPKAEEVARRYSF